MKTILERFEEKINKNEKTKCWEWRASTRRGYGLFKYKGKTTSAHRFSWELYNNKIPDGLLVLHKCDNPPCCNPDHLFLGTQKDNVIDMHNKGRGVDNRGSNSSSFDHTPYIFENKKKGWKIICTQSYLRTTFILIATNLSKMLKGNRQTCSGWSLIKENI